MYMMLNIKCFSKETISKNNKKKYKKYYTKTKRKKKGVKVIVQAI